MSQTRNIDWNRSIKRSSQLEKSFGAAGDSLPSLDPKYYTDRLKYLQEKIDENKNRISNPDPSVGYLARLTQATQYRNQAWAQRDALRAGDKKGREKYQEQIEKNYQVMVHSENMIKELQSQIAAWELDQAELRVFQADAANQIAQQTLASQGIDANANAIRAAGDAKANLERAKIEAEGARQAAIIAAEKAGDFQLKAAQQSSNKMRNIIIVSVIVIVLATTAYIIYRRRKKAK